MSSPRCCRCCSTDTYCRYPDRVNRIVVACVILLLVLAGCSGTPTSRPTGAALDAIFLNVVKADAPSRFDDASLIRAAHVICDGYDQAPSTTTWVEQVKTLTDNGFTGYQAGRMIGAATGSYCPQFSKYAPKA